MSVFDQPPHVTAGFGSFGAYVKMAEKLGLLQQAKGELLTFNLLKKSPVKAVLFLECCSRVNKLFANRCDWIELGTLVPLLPKDAMQTLAFAKVKDFARTLCAAAPEHVQYLEGEQGGSNGLQRLNFASRTALY